MIFSGRDEETHRSLRAGTVVVGGCGRRPNDELLGLVCAMGEW
jgi:hypothetical protein